MATATDSATNLAYDDEGAGTPVVFLHGLTFDRRTWRPIIERLDGRLRSIAIDLPAHGDSGGAPAPLDEIAAQLHELVGSLAVERPVVVGHSMSGGLASFYAATYPSRGLVTIDNGPDIRPFAQLVQQLEPALCGPGFTTGVAIVRGQPRTSTHPRTRALARARHSRGATRRCRRLLAAVLHTDPDELQAFIDAQIRQINVPFLAVFGRPITSSERERLGWLPDVQLEEWTGDGHFVHLVDPDRFATRLRQFVDHCTATAEAGYPFKGARNGRS